MALKKVGFTILGFLFISNIIAWTAVFDLSKPRVLQVNFFDVGQGDSIFIETPKKQQILIDGGPGSAVLEKLAEAMPFWDRTIDLIILTHPEKDHLSGLLEVLKTYKVENILWTGIVRETAEWKEWQIGILQENAQIKIAQAGQKIKASGVVLGILNPLENLSGREFKSSNNTSVVTYLVFGENSFLFTGDIEKEVEKELAESGENLDCNVLKIAHHGSKTSSSKEFIAKISPDIAVISAGKDNPYGHPAQEVLDILKNYGIRILRTDQDKDIKIISDGKNYEISNF